MNPLGDPKRRMKQGLKGLWRDLYWHFYGARIKAPELPVSPRSFLFVCKGNVCRSPFAEHAARIIAQELGIKDCECRSAGIEVSRSEPSPPNAVEAAEAFGIILKNHLSAPFEEKQAERFDAIIVLEGRHFMMMKNRYPRFKKKIFLLPLFEENGARDIGPFLRYNIPDPFGEDLDEFHACYRRIEQCLNGMFDRIFQRAGE